MGRPALNPRFAAASVAAFLLAVFIIAASTGRRHDYSSATAAAIPPVLTGAVIGVEDAGPSVVDYRRLDQRLQRLMERPNMIGLAVGVIEGGQIRFLKGYGETVAGSGDRVTPDTVFRWASLSKGVAADMLVKLAAEGHLSLDAPVGHYAASLHLPNGNEARASVIDLLSHRLGLVAHADEAKLEEGGDPKFLRATLAALSPACAPGQCWSYQNVAYDAASEIVGRVTGRPYQEVLVERLFRPLGMTSASVTREGLEGARSWARPYTGTKKSKPVEVTDSYYRVPAAGGVNSSIKDLAIWLQAQMGEAPTVLSQGMLDTVQAARVRTPGELGRMRKFRERLHTASYGLGWRVYDYAGHRLIGHRGGVTGYRSLILFDPALKSGVVALWNSSTNQPGGLEFEVMDMIYQLPPRDWLGVDSGAEAEPEDVTPA